MFNRFLRNRFGQKRSEDDAAPGWGRGLGRGFGCGAGGGGRGGGNRPGSGPGGNCVCPKCGYSQPHVAGQRCLDQACPQCGTRLLKE
jgi:hypothetical protein